jgi:hypothetical protein
MLNSNLNKGQFMLPLPHKKGLELVYQDNHQYLDHGTILVTALFRITLNDFHHATVSHTQHNIDN